MFGFSSGDLMTLDDERHLFVSVVSGWLRRAGGMPEPARNNRHKQVSLIIKSHQVSGRKTKHGLPPVNGNAEERF
ncbi:hypothetical protein QUG48_23930, partial [Enterobacter hormaechei]